jgi:hypothetical protein
MEERQVSKARCGRPTHTDVMVFEEPEAFVLNPSPIRIVIGRAIKSCRDPFWVVTVEVADDDIPWLVGHWLLLEVWHRFQPSAPTAQPLYPPPGWRNRLPRARRWCARRGRRPESQQIIELQRIGELGHRRRHGPIAAIERVFGLAMLLSASAACQRTSSLPPLRVALSPVMRGGVLSMVKAVAHQLPGQRIGGRIRRRVGSRHAEAVIAVRKGRRIPRKVLLRELLLSGFHSVSADAADLDRVDQASPFGSDASQRAPIHPLAHCIDGRAGGLQIQAERGRRGGAFSERRQVQRLLAANRPAPASPARGTCSWLA